MLAKIRNFFLITLLIVVVVGGGVGWYLLTGNYSEGDRSGNLIKLSRKGYVFKTWEGQLDLGGIGTTAQGDMSSRWEFSVYDSDQDVLDALNSASGRKIKLYYREKFYQFFWLGDTKYFAYRVEILE